MEKITIKTIEEKKSKTGTTFWACVSTNGSRYTVWDEKIAKEIGANLNITGVAELKQSQSGEFWNIRAFEGLNSTNPTTESEKVMDNSTIHTLKSKVIEKGNERPTNLRAMRNAIEITATELLRYSVKLTSEEIEYNDACELVWNTYCDFKKRLLKKEE